VTIVRARADGAVVSAGRSPCDARAQRACEDCHAGSVRVVAYWFECGDVAPSGRRRSGVPCRWTGLWSRHPCVSFEVACTDVRSQLHKSLRAQDWATSESWHVGVRNVRALLNDRYAVVEVAAVWTTLAQASQARAGCGAKPGGAWRGYTWVAGGLPVMIRPMAEPNWTDQLSAWSNLAMAVFSAVVAVFAYFAWRTAKAALIASREASEAAKASAEAARAANDQARLDSREQTRPYVWVEVVPGLAGVSTYDLRIANTGKSAARRLTLRYDEWPEPVDDVAGRLRELFDTPRTLPPGSSIRSMWRLEGASTDGTTEAGMGTSGTIEVSYMSDDPSQLAPYSDQYEVMIDKAGLWPVGDQGPDAGGLKGDARKFYLLGQALVSRVAELKR